MPVPGAVLYSTWCWRISRTILQVCIKCCVCRFTAVGPTHRSVYIYPDAVPPIHIVSYHVAMDKPPAQDGDKFWSIFSDNLQPIATRGKKVRGTLLVDQHCGNGCSIKRAPLSVSYYYNEISGSHIGRGLFGGGVLLAQYCPCGPTVFLCLCRQSAAECILSLVGPCEHVCVCDFVCEHVIVTPLVEISPNLQLRCS